MAYQEGFFLIYILLEDQTGLLMSFVPPEVVNSPTLSSIKYFHQMRFDSATKINQVAFGKNLNQVAIVGKVVDFAWLDAQGTEKRLSNESSWIADRALLVGLHSYCPVMPDIFNADLNMDV